MIKKYSYWDVVVVVVVSVIAFFSNVLSSIPGETNIFFSLKCCFNRTKRGLG